jgi:hypothetical protein
VLITSEEAYAHKFMAYNAKILIECGQDIRKEWYELIWPEADVHWAFKLTFENEYATESLEKCHPSMINTEAGYNMKVQFQC